MEKIQWLGLIFAVCSLLAFCWNIFSSKNNQINSTSASFFFSTFVGIALTFGPKHFSIQGLEYKEIKKEVQKAVDAKDAANEILLATREVLAIQEWNRGRIPPDDKEINLQLHRSIELFKSVYGNEYKSKMKLLINKGILRITNKEMLQFGLDRTIKPSIKPPLYEKSFPYKGTNPIQLPEIESHE